MDIKKIVRKILLEQEGGEVAPNQQPQLTKAQKEFLASLIKKWRQDAPTITDEQAMEIYLKYREVIPLIKNESQQSVYSFIERGQGKYTINDLRDISNVNIHDLLSFLLEIVKFRISIGGNLTDSEMENMRIDAIFNKRTDKGTDGITPEKIELSKQMWENEKNLIINEDNFRVYWVPDKLFALRLGYYYQEKLRELMVHNVDNNVNRQSVNPWCIASRNMAQSVYYKNKEIINGVSNAYGMYRRTDSYYFIIDESKDLFGSNGEYYFGALLADSRNSFQLASMYNGQKHISHENLLKIYPKLNGHLDKFVYHKYDESAENNDGKPISILDRINEQEGSPYAFWLQGPDEKSQYINDNRIIRNPKSWKSLSDELRIEYITRMRDDDVLSKVNTYEFMRTIIKSGNVWKGKLNYKLVTLGFSAGIGYLAENLMIREFALDFTGKKNSNIKIYKSKTTKKYGIYNLDVPDWLEKDGISYEPLYTKNILKAPYGDLFDDENNKEYIVTEFQSPSAKFYTLTDFDDIGRNFDVFILSEKKYNELREKVEEQGMNDENDVDISEEQY
jgi:hypothetical protein